MKQLIHLRPDLSPARFFASTRPPNCRSNTARGQRKERHLMKAKILRNIFLSGGVLFTLARLLAAAMSSILLLGILAPGVSGGTSDGVLNFNVTTFDVPDAASTSAFDINDLGTVTGWYFGPNFEGIHGFVRTRGGAITTFDVPGSLVTSPNKINREGTITGDYIDLNGFIPVEHGFLRDPSGNFTTFDGAAFTTGTSSDGINQSGAVVGSWEDPAIHKTYGFVRQPSGRITSFDLNFGQRPRTGTEPLSISLTGDITGDWNAEDGVIHGFVRTRGGAITSFDAPGATSTSGKSINQFGSVAGEYVDQNSVIHGFVRNSDGMIITLDVPGAGTGISQGTVAVGINRSGAVTGFYVDPGYVYHGFVRASDGSFTMLDAPGAGTEPFQGTRSFSINDFGMVTGTFIDASGLEHGLVAFAF